MAAKKKKSCAAPQPTPVERTPPPYDDDAALAEFIEDVLHEHAYLDACEDDAREYPLDFDQMRPIVSLSSIEREAIADAEHGDFDALADMVARGYSLSQEARAMVVARLKDEFRSRPGRSRRSYEEYELDWKVEASKEVGEIAHILKFYYPEEKGHTERAIDIAAVRAVERALQPGSYHARFAGEISRQKLANYYTGSRHRRR